MEKLILIPYEKYQRLLQDTPKNKDPVKPRTYKDIALLSPPGERENKRKKTDVEKKKKPMAKKQKTSLPIDWISFWMNNKDDKALF